MLFSRCLGLPRVFGNHRVSGAIPRIYGVIIMVLENHRLLGSKERVPGCVFIRGGPHFAFQKQLSSGRVWLAPSHTVDGIN